MKKVIVLSFSFFLGLNSLVFAQETKSLPQVTNLPLPQNGQVDEHLPRLSPIKLLPDHPIYFLITWKENAQRFLEGNVSQKAHFDTILAGKRIKETYLLIQKGNFKTSMGTVKRYSKQMERLEKELSGAQKQGADVVTTLDLLADNLFRHQDLMAQIISSVPDEQKEEFLRELNWANEKLIAVTELLEKGRPDQAQRLLSRYREATESARP
ncbi:hypothetical protein A2Z23_00770 [Candidatus Curtissbacteria bacterium RBG_16_39_7]|uniref:DUF5667 domain-containing protein n=1 Tax=Candidatus Curtissbacteria bacterium RBG_16_39_7 TaxID=1797707 RepID=A0A1F5G1S5_9BACT|nr:MAG: hypothetical protein A2Z23_00770 [Candidatus Curtissbacteria bacterium RBG_16_39_7]